MKPSKKQSMLLHRYFNKILGYGNKCQCKRQGNIQNFTDNIIEFYCRWCSKRWGFEPKIKPTDMMVASLGI